MRLVDRRVRAAGRAEGKKDRVGSVSKLTSLAVTPTYNEISIMINGYVNHMIVRSQKETLEQGASVMVVDFDDESNRPIITRVEV